MSDSMKAMLEEYTKGIEKIFGDKLRQIILYGSQARGDANQNSDIDIMVLVEMSDMEIKEKMDELVELSFEFDMNYNVVVSPIVNNVENFIKWVKVVPFYKNVQKEGVILSGRN